ncbi:sugar phosphate isomerase/epimerase [Mycoplasmatota bacterium]|nr:sugar phosphate isomerase/epimerase [Mycoplasmatota bacterium]
MKLKYGMPSLVEFNSIEENVLFCKKLQLDFVELNMNMFYCLPENNNIKKINLLRDKYQIDFTMHFPEEIDFGTFYEEVQDANIALFQRYVEYGAKIGVETINVHLLPGVRITLPDKIVWSYEKNIDKYITNLTEAFKKLIAIAKPYHIKVCIENTRVPSFLENVFLKLKNIEDLYFTYDIGHDAKSNYNVEPIYQKLGEKVKHMHLHDYDKVTDHQVLFKGIINLYDKLEFAKRNQMRVVIEVKTTEALKKSVENLLIRHLK